MKNNRVNHWYVLVLTTAGPKFVTKLGTGHTCYWKIDEAPLEVSKEWARDMCVGLAWNGFPAYPVCVNYEISSQPFMYKNGSFEWHENTEN